MRAFRGRRRFTTGELDKLPPFVAGTPLEVALRFYGAEGRRFSAGHWEVASANRWWWIKQCGGGSRSQPQRRSGAFVQCGATKDVASAAAAVKEEEAERLEREAAALASAFEEEAKKSGEDAAGKMFAGLVASKDENALHRLKLALSHLPYPLLMRKREWHNVDGVAEPLASFISSDVVSSALFRESEQTLSTLFKEVFLTSPCACPDTLRCRTATEILGYNPAKGFFTNNESSLQLRGLDAEETAHYALPMPPQTWFSWVTTQGRLATVKTFEEFQDNLDICAMGMLRGVKFGKVIITGGCVTGCLLPLPAEITALRAQWQSFRVLVRTRILPQFPAHVFDVIWDNLKRHSRCYAEWEKVATVYFHYPAVSPFWDADIDIFFVCESLTEAAVIFRETLLQVCHNLDTIGEPYFLVRTHNAVTVTASHPRRHVQLVFPVARCLLDVLLLADLDCTALAYDGANVWGLPRSFRCFATRRNFMDPQLVISASRLAKYAHRGFSIAAFDWRCSHLLRCDRDEVDVDFACLRGKRAKSFLVRQRGSVIPYVAGRPIKEVMAKWQAPPESVYEETGHDWKPDFVDISFSPVPCVEWKVFFATETLPFREIILLRFDK
eukprot:TRINITY_DN5596_c0_g1_i3.p1 TRINITY_DN5596_c0_g1~~TRINITY_DN5596_c0_g1_i3.p1  ORF type:complete len:624 (-),score=130.35 TRINITY_DN5596_c0_g1_i3:190-2025(-)